MEEVDYGATPIEAMRLFILNEKNLTLNSIAAREIWLPGEVKHSVCSHARAHGNLPPEVDCTCGIWSCKNRKQLHYVMPVSAFDGTTAAWNFGRRRSTFVSARLLQWGTVIEHQYGYRSEFAQIVPHTIQWYPRRGKFYRAKLLQYLREKYQTEEVL